jgi:hypothetical protein
MKRVYHLARERLTPSMVIAVVALIAAMGGGAAAASSTNGGTPRAHGARSHSDARQDRAQLASFFNSHRASLVGPAGSRGPQGNPGNPGDLGPPGPTGPSSATGIKHSAAVQITSTDTSSPTTIASLTLGPGAWAISGKVDVTGTVGATATCHLFASDAADFDTSETTFPSSGAHATVPLEIQHTTSANTWTVTLGCLKDAAPTIAEETNAEITAIKLGSETHTGS